MIRTRLKAKLEGNQYYCRFHHPVREKTVCICLGSADEQAINLRALERIRQDQSLWLNPPADTPINVRNAWMGPDSIIKILGDQPMRGAVRLRVDGADTARLQAELDRANREIDRMRNEVERQAAELVHWRGRKTSTGVKRPLGDAVTHWYDNWNKGKSKGNCKLVRGILRRFAASFGESLPLDYFIGKERELLAWINDQKCKIKGVLIDRQWGPSVRQRAEIYICKFFLESGYPLEHTIICKTTRKDRIQARGKIRYIETREEAELLAKHLSGYWRSAFLIQLALGLRPSELPTIQRCNFSQDLGRLTLEPLGSLSLKTGSRNIPVPESVRSVVSKMLESSDFLFPRQSAGFKAHFYDSGVRQKHYVDRAKTISDLRAKGLTYSQISKEVGVSAMTVHYSLKNRIKGNHFNKPYRSADGFCRAYLKQLRRAAEAAKLNLRIDSRVPRRTCASWLLQANVGADRIAKLLGNSASVILECYGDPNLGTIDSNTITGVREEKE